MRYDHSSEAPVRERVHVAGAPSSEGQQCALCGRVLVGPESNAPQYHPGERVRMYGPATWRTTAPPDCRPVATRAEARA